MRPPALLLLLAAQACCQAPPEWAPIDPLTVASGVRVPVSLYEWLELEARKRGLSTAAYVRQVLYSLRDRAPKT